jgi:molybdate/tungstate transport system substrate-binding protein
VLYAGSLTNLMEKHLGPAFENATGDTFQGYAAGSTELAKQITGKVRRGDVFVSASPKADHAAGHFVRWYATFATAPVVIGYNPKSRYAADFKAKPWYDVVTEPGIKVGRTDPKLDPKGTKTVAALDEAAAKLHQPALKKALSSFPAFPEETLVGRLQSGQLDAGFFYSIEAKAIGLPTVSIKPAAQHAAYTVTVLENAPDEAAAEDFVRSLLGHHGTAMLKAAAFHVVSPPNFSGSRSAVPAGLRSAVGAG